MNNTFKIIEMLLGAAMVAVVLSLLLSSCAKEGGNGVDATLSFSTDTPELVEVKAAAVTSVSNFYATGYAVTDATTTQWFPTTGGPQNVTLSGGTATFGDYKWIYGDSKTFYAYSNNLPANGATASITSDGVTLTYTAIPTDASAQTDVSLGRYSGNGDNKGEAALTFYHPLAQVVFKMGDMAGVSSLNKIEIKGVYNAGTTTLNTSTGTTSVTQASGSGTASIANFSWTNISGSATVFQTITGALPSKDSEIGVPFMLIPQNLATQNVTVSVTVTTTGGSSVTLTKKLTTGSFATGKKTVCTLTVNPARELGCNLTAYGEDTDDDIFKTGPNPNYWVDLGMVSENGHKLYVAVYDVKTLDASGNITFADTGTPITKTFSQLSSRTEFTAPDGLTCRLMTPAEAKNFFCKMFDISGTQETLVENKNISWNNSSYLGTSNITGKTIQLSSDNYLLQTNGKGAVLVPSSGEILTTEFGTVYIRLPYSFMTFNISSYPSRLRMVYEDVSVSYPIKNKIVYGRNLSTYPSSSAEQIQDNTEYYLGADGAAEIRAFCPVITFEGTNFVAYSSAISIGDGLGNNLEHFYSDDQYHLFLNESGMMSSTTRTISLSYAGETIVSFKANGRFGHYAKPSSSIIPLPDQEIECSDPKFPERIALSGEIGCIYVYPTRGEDWFNFTVEGVEDDDTLQIFLYTDESVYTELDWEFNKDGSIGIYIPQSGDLVIVKTVGPIIII